MVCGANATEVEALVVAEAAAAARNAMTADSNYVVRAGVDVVVGVAVVVVASDPKVTFDRPDTANRPSILPTACSAVLGSSFRTANPSAEIQKKPMSSIVDNQQGLVFPIYDHPSLFRF